MSWFWIFGDGNFVIGLNLVYIYSQFGIYIVCLEVSSFCGSVIDCEIVQVSCVVFQVQFFFQFNELEVVFIDVLMVDLASWAWDFGDGIIFILFDFIYFYVVFGDYIVCLMVGSVCGIIEFC